MNTTTKSVLPTTKQNRWVTESPFADTCRGLLHRLHWPENLGLRTLGLVSSRDGHGVTTLVRQLGAAAASFPERRIVLVDADWQRATLTQLGYSAGKMGLTDLFFSDASLSDILAAQSSHPHLLPLGSRSMPLHAVDTRRWATMLEQLRDTHDLVIVDLPSLHRTQSQLGLAALLDGVLFVARAGATQEDDVVHARRALMDSGGHLIGALWNEGID